MGSAASSAAGSRPSSQAASVGGGAHTEQAVALPPPPRAGSAPAATERDLPAGRQTRQRQRIAYRAPTLGGSREASADDHRADNRTGSSQCPSEVALSSSMLRPKSDAFVRRARSSLVTADGLVNSGDIESTVKQRRRMKKVPSATAMREDGDTPRSARERPGSAYARSAHSKAAGAEPRSSRYCRARAL